MQLLKYIRHKHPKGRYTEIKCGTLLIRYRHKQFLPAK